MVGSRQLHFPAEGYNPAEEYSAERNGVFHGKMFFVNDIRFHFLTKAVNDAVHDIFAVGKDTSSFILP